MQILRRGGCLENANPTALHGQHCCFVDRSVTVSRFAFHVSRFAFRVAAAIGSSLEKARLAGNLFDPDLAVRLRPPFAGGLRRDKFRVKSKRHVTREMLKRET